MKPLFSIIIPVFNVEKYLKECLDSILSQAFESCELICVDDEGSIDGSREILMEYVTNYPDKIKVVKQPDEGLSAARNLGMVHATGNYFLFLDSDDLITPNSLERLRDCVIAQNPDIIAFNSDLYFFEGNKRREANNGFNHPKAIEFSTGMDYFNYFVSTRGWGPSAVCLYLFKSDILIKNKLQFKQGMLHEDELFMPQVLCYAGKTITIPETLYYYRIREQSTVRTQTEKNYLDKQKIAEILFGFFSERDCRNCYTDRVIYNLTLASINGLMNGQRNKKKISFFYRRLLFKTAHSLKENAIAVMNLFGMSVYKTYYKIIKR